MVMKVSALALIGTTTVAAGFGFPATAHADIENFQSPSGNIFCILDSNGAACDVRDHAYQLPRPPECAQMLAWGDRFTLDVGKPAAITCHGDTLQVPGESTLNYGQTQSAGTLSCQSQPSGIKCTDSKTGHYFRAARDSYDLG